MKGKIARRLLFTGLISMLITLIVCLWIFHGVFQRQTEQDLRISAEVIAAACGERSDPARLRDYDSSALRITLVQPDGAVVYDSLPGVPPGNRLDCPEVRRALAEGSGASRRVSEATGRETDYYALLLQDGAVLRVSIDAAGRFALFRSAFPALFLCCLVVAALSMILSVVLTKQLVRPIVHMGENLEDIGRDVPYPELRPFVDSIVRDRTIRRTNEQMRQEFTANVSHELKTPLTSISGYAELIETGMAKPEDVAGFAGRIRRESSRLLHLVNDILQLSKLDAASAREKTAAEFEEVDLRDVAAACVERLGVNAQRAYVTLLLKGEHAAVLGSRAGIDELCVNLCDNAIRYNKPGGKVTVSCGIAEGRPYLRVQDTGIGIPEEQQERVFERFYRVDKSRSKATGGTGLGLAIVKHLAALHDARVELASTVDVGTDVCVYFPKRG